MKKRHIRPGIWPFKVNILKKLRPWNEVMIVYIVDDICYADSNAKEIRVVEVKPLVGRMLLVTFSSGEKRLFDTTKITGSAFDILDDEEVFNHPTVFHGVITWNDGDVDIASETVYDASFPYNTEV